MEMMTMPKTLTNKEINEIQSKHNSNVSPKTLGLKGEFDISAADTNENRKRGEFTLVGYTGDVINQWFGTVIVDLAGMEVATDQIPILATHENSTEAVVGSAMRKDITISEAGVIVSGKLYEGDETAENIMLKAKQGHVWQSSIGAKTLRMEWLEEDEKETINGREVVGPMYIARKTMLQEQSIVALGADPNTTADIVAKKDDGLTINEKEAVTMPKETEVKASKAEVEVKPQNVDASEAVSAIQAETLRCKGIMSIEAKSEESKLIIEAALKDEKQSIDTVKAQVELADTRNQAIEDLRASRAVPNVNMNASVNAVKQQDAIEAAFALTYAPGVAAEMEKSNPAQIEAGQKLGFMGIKALASHAQVAAGGSPLTFGSTEQDIMAALSTSSIPTIVSNVANKYIAEKFTNDDAVSVIRKVTKAKTVNDFKVNTGARLAAGGAFQKIAEGQEIPLANISDASYTHSADMFGQRIGITRQMIINDDLGMLMDLIDQMILNGMDAFVDTFVAALKAADGSGFFAAGNSNLNTSTTVPGSAGLKAMNQLFAGMTDDRGRKTQIMPKYILSPADLIADAQEIYVSTEVRDTTASKKAGTQNIYRGRYEPLQLNYLDAAEWYGFADPQRTPAFVASYLFGRQMPTILPGQTQYKDLSEMMVGYFDFGIDEAMTQGAVKMK
jgi:phage head maturation protease